MPPTDTLPRSRRYLTEWLLLVGTLLTLGGYIGFVQYQDHQQIDTQERERLATQAKVIAENLGQQLLATRLALDSIHNDLPFLRQQLDGKALVNRRLKAMSDAIVGVRTLLVLDADGNASASDRAPLIGQNFSGREYFQIAQRNPDPSVLFVSPPFKTVLGVFAMNVVKVTANERGEFAGLISATLDPDYFNVVLSSVRYAPDMWTSIAHADGKLVLMSPQGEATAGTDLATPGSFYTRHRDSGQTTTVMIGPVHATGEQRMMAQRTLKPVELAMDKPLLVAVSRDLSSLFAPWQRGAYQQGALFGMLVLVASLGLFFHQRRQRVHGRLETVREAQRQQAELALRDSEAYNKVLFAGSHIALAVLDPETGRLLDCNQAMVAIHRLASRDALLTQWSADLGTPSQYDGRSSAEAAEKHIQEALRTGAKVFEWRHQRHDGQIWDAEVHLMAFEHDGRTLLQFSLQDISERKRAEADLRIAAAAFESQEGMLITDVDQKILRINAACSAITGYSAEETIGQTPHLFSSGRHDTAFYRAMWASIAATGSWTGELWNRRKNGEVYPAWSSISAVKGDDGPVSHYVASFIDISQRKTAEEEIKHLAFYDPLTRLPNRRLLIDRLRQALLTSSRNESAGALLFIDLDNFKTLNDTLGHDKGDLLLESVAHRLSAALREEDTVARLGGDEFVIMMEGLSLIAQDAAAQATLVADKLLNAFKTPHDLAGLSHHCTASIGIALFMGQTDTVDELLKQADLAMYQAKSAGRNSVRFFDPEMQSAVMARAALEADLREGLRQQQLRLYYQPQVDDDGRTTGAEALVRWQHPLRGMIPPLDFIALAEETGLILPLGHWVLETACQQLVAWADRPEMAHFTVAVNVSARQLRQPDFVDQVVAVLQSTGANPRRLKLELTESLLVANVEDVIEKMFALKAKGVSFSLDDFGTGYSSLSYLKRLPLDQLKIDQSFVRDIHVDPNDAAIARTIVALAHSLGLGVIAEGVETQAQRDFLASAGCHAHQGYFFSRALPIADFERFAQRG
ncbi:EAL domain-containing protein [Rhodoferax sp.]|uniref:bifunctional diguanylate cyclase/phosphodiesterase n=1 Tax=Rhodoferax sp. TaxID=50421 RepID=UPI002771C09D|nr:EAL domain-containing protein [Rhodoferax sp.]